MTYCFPNFSTIPTLAIDAFTMRLPLYRECVKNQKLIFLIDASQKHRFHYSRRRISVRAKSFIFHNILSCCGINKSQHSESLLKILAVQSKCNVIQGVDKRLASIVRNKETSVEQTLAVFDAKAEERTRRHQNPSKF
ncbi:hypothetical protein TNCV_2411551 [Trichonephila clavipes]|nr:hypothetical protein TNCV_2411551 [Trichonephila clavipes]